MITIAEWLKRNNVHKSVIEKGRGIVAIAVQQDESPDTVVTDQSTDEAIYLKKITDLKLQVNEKARVFVIGTDQWEKMTKKNLFMANLKKQDNEP